MQKNILSCPSKNDLSRFCDDFRRPFKGIGLAWYNKPVSSPVWPVKRCQISIKVAQQWFPKKIERFWQLYKNWLNCWQFGRNNCCHKLRKVAQSSIYRLIWSHWSSLTGTISHSNRRVLKQAIGGRLCLPFDKNNSRSWFCFKFWQWHNLNNVLAVDN